MTANTQITPRQSKAAKITDAVAAISALHKVGDLTLNETSILLVELAGLFERFDPELAKRTRQFYYTEFHHPEPETKPWLPSERDIQDALDMQRSEPKQEAWKRSGEVA